MPIMWKKVQNVVEMITLNIFVSKIKYRCGWEFSQGNSKIHVVGFTVCVCVCPRDSPDRSIFIHVVQAGIADWYPSCFLPFFV